MKQWLCYLHVKCIGFVFRTIQHDNCLFSEKIACDVFHLMLNLSAWLSAEKQAFVNLSMSLLFLILSLASGSSKTRGVLQKLRNPLDLMSALEVYFHLYMDNSCIVWRLLWNFFLWSIFTFCVRLFRTKLGIITHLFWFIPWRNFASI